MKTSGQSLRGAAVALTLGALSAYGHPGIGLGPLMLVGLIALAYLACSARSMLGAVLRGFAFGIAIFSVITIASREWAPIVPISLTLIGTILYAIPQAVMARLCGRRPYDLPSFVAVVCAWSLVMDIGDAVGFPTKGEALATITTAPFLLGGARLVGMNIVCGVLVAGAVGVGVRAAREPPLRWTNIARSMVPIACSLILLSATAALARATAPGSGEMVRVGIPQMNVPNAYFAHRQEVPQLSDAFEAVFAEQLAQLTNVDLLALTETYDGAYPLLAPKVRRGFESYAKLQRQAVLLTSFLPAENGGIYNAVGGIDASGKLVGIHRKVNLAPFGEVEFDAGRSFAPITLAPNLQVGVLICQESLLPDGPHALALAGANLLVGPTSDISFGSGLLAFEHLALARMRSIETGRALVWASAAGPSGAVDRWGGFAAAAPFRAAKAAEVEVALHGEVTPYTRSRDWLPGVTLTLLAVVCFTMRRRPVCLTPPRRSEVGAFRGLGEFALALLLSAGMTLGSAAAVEVANGTPERALRSAQELMHSREIQVDHVTRERFRVDPKQSAAGAVAYFLDFYGQRTVPSALPSSEQVRTLDDLVDALGTLGFPAQRKSFNTSPLPKPAAIVLLKSGEFGVITSNRNREVWLFRPTRASVTQLTVEEARATFGTEAIVPNVTSALGTHL